MVQADTQLLRVIDGWQRRQAWPHAVLLTGSERSGLFSQALYLASRLLCEQGQACGECAACQRVSRFSHIDLHLLASPPTARHFGLPVAEGAGDRYVIRKEDVLETCRALSLKAHAGGWRVILCLRPEEMNKEAANTLLKTLEEPGDQCLFVLVSSEPKALLTTIVSRCQRLQLRPQTRAELCAAWSEEGCEHSKADVLAAMDLRGMSVSPEVLQALRPLAMGWLKAVNASHGGQELDLAEAMNRQGMPESVLRVLRSLLSDLLAIDAACDDEDLTHRDRTEELRGLVSLDPLAMAEVLDTAAAALRRNVSLISILIATARGEKLT
ncbi:MAG: hypothetical protein CMH55_07470 [Myxococcales bacterium]|nr:hypothetical protein [Myxococcales bacterium]|tara:strand:+ start:2385 stop:3362 length:978 start_codon:yes stop_codon:yes gene_type:complete